MKRIISLFAIASLAVLSLSCEKEIESPEPAKAELYTYSFEAFDADADKSTFDGSKITWKEGDQVGYFVDDFSGNSEIGSDQKFTISTTKPVTGETLYAYVPYVAGNASKTSVNITIPESQDSDNLVMPAFGAATVAADGVVPIKLSNLGSIVAFKLYSATGAYSSEKVTSITMTSTTNAICGTFTKDITASSALEISGYDKNAVTVRVNGDLTAASSKENATVVYAVIAPGTYDGNIVVTTDAATYTYPFSSQTFQRSHSKGLVLNFEKAGVRESVEPIPDPVYVKVTSDSDLTDGQYLIVCEDQNVAFNGGLSTLDASSNTVVVTISNNEIAYSAGLAAAEFAFTSADGSFKSASGKYIGNSADSNGMNASTNTLSNTVTINDGNADIKAAGGSYLRYNATSGQDRFRYFKSSTYTQQKAIQLYKFTGTAKTLTSIAVSGTPTKTEYNVGESFDPAGLVVTGTYSDGSSVEIEDDIEWTITPETFTEVIDKVRVTAKVGDITSDSFEVNVSVAEVVEKEFTIFQDTLVEGDYIIYYNGYALKNVISSSRFSYATVEPSNNVISTSDESIVWHLEKVGDYWTLFNADVEKYAAGTTSKNQGALIDEVTNFAKWTCTVSDGKYEFVNLGRANATSDPGNKYLRNNGTNGFACYANGTGGALTLYRNGEVEKVSVTGISLKQTESVEKGKTVALVPTIAPSDASNQNVTWSSNDQDVATVNNGVVTGVAVGTAEITATTVDGGFTAKCVVTVTAATIPVYDSLEELVAAGTPTEAGDFVTVTLTNDEITDIFTTKAGERRGVYFNVPKGSGSQKVEIFYTEVIPTNWEVGGTLSGTLVECEWKIYSGTWELCPTDRSELTYSAPLVSCATPVITISEGFATISCETSGASIYYTLDGSDPSNTSNLYTEPVTMTSGQTIKAIAYKDGMKPSSIASGKYSTEATDKTFVFTSKAWDDVTKSWTSGKDGGQLTSGQGVQVTKTGSGANATTKSSFTNVSKVIVNYCTNKSDGVGTISIKIGNNEAIVKDVTKTGGTTLRDLEYIISPEQTGPVTITVTCTTNSIYVNSVTITSID